MADLDDRENLEDATPVDEVVTAYAPRVRQSPGDVWRHLDEDLRARFEAEYWPALSADEQATEAGQPAEAVAEVLRAWWPMAQLCARPGGRSALDEADRQRAAGTLKTVPFDFDRDD